MSKSTIRAVLTSDLSDPNSVSEHAEQFRLSNPRRRPSTSTPTAASTAPRNRRPTSPRPSINTTMPRAPTRARCSRSTRRNITTRRFRASRRSTISLQTTLSSTSLDGVRPDARTLTSKTLLRQVLTSDLSDPNSVANQQTDPAYKKLAAGVQLQCRRLRQRHHSDDRSAQQRRQSLFFRL